MKISVVIPAHNRPELLLEAVTSIAKQTYFNWEVVVVDDGSSPALVIDQVNARLGRDAVFLRHETPRGVARAKNAGIKAATGEIVTLLDDDDLLVPNALEQIAQAFALHPELDCVFLGVEPFGPYAANPAQSRKKAIDKILHRLSPAEADGLYLFDGRLFTELLHSVPIDFQRPAARKGTWNIVGGFDEHGLFSESSWTIIASTQCRMALTKAPLSHWRIHDNNFGWPPGLAHEQAVLRQIDNGLASAQALAQQFHRKQQSVRMQLNALDTHLAENCFTKAYFLRDKHKWLGLKTLLRSMYLSPRLKHFKLLVRYLLPRTPSKSKSPGT